MEVTEDANMEMVAAAQRKLKVLRHSAEAMEHEQKNKEAILKDLEKTIEELHERRRDNLARVHEYNCDTASVMDDLCLEEKLETLEGMLIEKNSKLHQRQLFQKMLVEQLSHVEETLNSTPATLRADNGETHVSNVVRESECQLYHSEISSHVKGIHRFCFEQMMDGAELPVSIFYSGVSKIARIARDREVELEMQAEKMSEMSKQMMMEDGAQRDADLMYKKELERLQRKHRHVLQSMARAASAEMKDLRNAIQTELRVQHELRERLEAEVTERSTPVVKVDLPHVAGNSQSASDGWNSLNRREAYVSADSELQALHAQVENAKADVQRLQQQLLSLREEETNMKADHLAHTKIQEAKLHAAEEAAAVLKKENTEWQSLRQQMSLLPT